MKYSIFLILFIIYSIVIFLTNNYLIVLGFIIINILLSLIFHINIKKFYHLLLNFIPFVLFTMVVNLIFSNYSLSLLIGIRLMIVFNITFIFSELVTPLIISEAISKLLYPLKIFKVNYQDISLIITIALSFIPILSREAINIKYALEAKGFKFNFKNIIKQPHLFILTYMHNVFRRIDEVEKTLLAKAYE